MPQAHTPTTQARPSPRREALHRLAEDLAVLCASGGAATEEDLHHLGWTAEQLADLLPEARALAGRVVSAGAA